ncbi:MAG: hypothetical protein HYZ14_11480 [Bacteroidetes bacterium]|nr:hypothetical protein [Bacteroidota bacterium]
MKRKISLLLASVLSIYFFAGCSAERTREDKVSAMINKVESPFIVVSMTPQNLMDKSGVMDGVLPFTYELVLSFFIDEAVTGIDYGVKSQIVIGKGESFQPAFYGIFKVKDEKKFVDLIEKEANATIVEKEGMKTAIKESDGYAVVWNEEFAVISNIPVDFMAMLSGTGGNGGEKTVNKLVEIIKSADDGEINQTYADFLKKESDLSMYYDGKGFYGFLEEMMGEEIGDVAQMKETYEGITSEMYLNFKDGAISLDFTNHLSDKVKESMSFIQGKGVSDKLLSYGNSANMVMTGAYNVDFAKFFEYIEGQMGEDVYSDMEEELAAMGLTTEDVKSAMSGEFVYMIDRVVEMEETLDFGYGEPYVSRTTIPMFAVALGISNAGPVQKLLADSLKLPNGSYKMGDAYVVMDGDVLFASNDSAWTNKVLTKSTSAVTKGKDLLTANPFAMFVDFTSLAQMEGLNDAEPFVKLFTEFSAGGNLEGGSFNFNLADASKNSLRVITEMVAAELDRMEKEMNKELESELEDAVMEGLNELEESVEKEL